MQPVSVDAFGNVMTWFSMELGAIYIERTIPDSEKPYRVPMLMRAVPVWQSEQRAAIERARKLERGKKH